jgi:hypothetical protein
MTTIVTPAEPSVSTDSAERLHLVAECSTKPVRRFVQLDAYGGDMYGAICDELRNTDGLRIQIPEGWTKAEAADRVKLLMKFYKRCDGWPPHESAESRSTISPRALQIVLLDGLKDIEKMAGVLHSFLEEGSKRDAFGFVVGTLGLCAARMRELLKDDDHDIPF